MSTYYANDKYNAVLTAGYSVGQTTLYVSAVPNHVPTIIVAAKGTDKETVFAVTDKTTNSLTGVSRLRGANVDLDAQTPLTCLNNEEFQNQYASIYNQLINGWNELGALTRASDTTATLSGDWTDRLQKGDKLWWKSNGVSRYNYIIGISYSAPNTTITITAGYVSAANDSRFENGQTITEPRYSKVENPQGFPHWFNYTTTYTCEGAMTYSSVTQNYCKFALVGTTCIIKMRAMGTTGGSASNAIYFTLPIGASSMYGLTGASAAVFDGGGVKGAFIWERAADKCGIFKYDASNYALGGSEIISCQLHYEIG